MSWRQGVLKLEAWEPSRCVAAKPYGDNEELWAKTWLYPECLATFLLSAPSQRPLFRQLASSSSSLAGFRAAVLLCT